MATVTGVTKQRVDALAGDMIVGATKSGTSLVFTKANGGIIQVPNAFLPKHMNYAVGQIYMTDRSENPANYLGGGTWARWGKGRVPVSLDEATPAFDSPDETGGASEVTLGIPNMPNHDHGTWTGDQDRNHTHTGYTGNGAHNHTYLQNDTQGNLQGGGGIAAADNVYTLTLTGGDGSHTHPLQTHNANQGHLHQITAQGGGQPFSVVQPFITCYMWKKTAD